MYHPAGRGLTLFRAGTFKAPVQVFLAPLPNAARLKAQGLFLNIHCAHFDKEKLPGQVRSGHQRRFVHPTSEKFANTPVLEFLTDKFLLFRF